TPSQLSKLHRTADVRIYSNRSINTRGGLLGGLTSTTNSLTSSLNGTLASSPVGALTSGAVAPVVSTVVTIPLVSSLTSPLVMAASGSTALQDGSGVSNLTLLYQTDYPMLVGADSLQKAGITGKGVTIAVLDTGLWQDLSQNYGGRILASVDVLNGGSG